MKTWFVPLDREYGRTSARSFALVAASMLDELVKQLLVAHLLPPTGRDSLFGGPHAPLGSFSARIDLSHRIGLISPRLARDLHLIRRIRNDFAHSFDDLSFSTPEIAQRV